MRRVVITRHGPPEVLRLEPLVLPDPRGHQVRIRVHFAGVNFSEVMARMGLYPGAPNPPAGVGSEVSGVVDAVGETVTRFQVGDRVMGFCRFGAYATHVLTEEEMVIPLPQPFGFEEGAAFPIVYTTAQMMLFDLGNLRAGQTVLIHGAGGGVGIAAIQLAKAAGALTIGTASAWKHARLKELGLDHAIDYRTERPAQRTLEFTGGRGVDIALDPLGARSWQESYSVLAPLGKLIIFGDQAMVGGLRRNPLSALREYFRAHRPHPLSMMSANRSVMGFHLGRLEQARPRVTAAVEQLIRLAERGTIHPIIDSVIPCTDAPAAHRRMQERKNLGKILIDFRQG